MLQIVQEDESNRIVIYITNCKNFYVSCKQNIYIFKKKEAIHNLSIFSYAAM